MQYALLIYENEQDWDKIAESDRNAIFAEYMTFSRDIVKSGNMRGGEALQPTETATTVRVRDGKTLKTDGPFAETKEVLGGYYLVDCKDLDRALELASRIPGAQHGSIEVRPVMELPADLGAQPG